MPTPHLNCVTWNITRHVKKFEDADGLVISVSKSGRTWLRVLLGQYFALSYGYEYDPAAPAPGHPDAPKLFYTHELFEHRNNARLWEKLRGRYIVPQRVLDSTKVVLMYRDPRDVVVSYFHQKTKRSARRVDLDVSAFIRHPTWGIGSIIYVMNAWRNRLAAHPDCCWLSYESLREDTPGGLSRVAGYLDGREPDPATVQAAVDYADFQNMKKREAAGQHTSGVFSAGDVSNPDSYKVRKGKVGGYAEELSPADRDYVDRAVLELDDWYGYR